MQNLLPRVAWALCLDLAISPIGCSGHRAPTDGEVAALAGSGGSRSSGDLTSSLEIWHDLGPILSGGREIPHDFSISNPTTHDIRILGVTPSTPCCTAVAAFPKLVRAGGPANISVIFRPASQTGVKQASFYLESDETGSPSKRLVLAASLFAEWEVADEAPTVRTLSLGKGGKRRFRVICRRQGDRGRPLPSGFSVSGDLKGCFVGEVARAEPAPGFIEASRLFEVDLPPTAEPGLRQEAARFSWDGGSSRRVPIGWTAEPKVRVNPSGLTLSPGEAIATRDISITSDDSTFRITGLSGLLLAGPTSPDDRPSRSHRLRLRLDPSRSAGAVASDILITTDHPDQRLARVSAMILPAGGAAQ